jgi:hypothetical protein
MKFKHSEIAATVAALKERNVNSEQTIAMLEELARIAQNEESSEEKLRRASEQAKAQAESIAEMVAALNVDRDRLEELRDAKKEAEESGEAMDSDELDELRELEEAAGDTEDEDDARRRIEEDPLSVQVRSDWHNPGEEGEAAEFEILLCTGGPAVRIRGELGEHNEPSRAWIEYQDWFTPWTEYHGEGVSSADLLTYCRTFYWGD